MSGKLKLISDSTLTNIPYKRLEVTSHAVAELKSRILVITVEILKRWTITDTRTTTITDPDLLLTLEQKSCKPRVIGARINSKKKQIRKRKQHS